MAIRAVHNGEAFLSPSMTKVVLEDYLTQPPNQAESRYDSLTLREKQVLRLAAEGKTTREMAELLYLSVKTVEKHRGSMMHKLQLQSLPDLIKFAIRKGLIEVDED